MPFDPEQDAWHAPTQCVWDAAYCAGLIGCFVALEWSVPDDLQEHWALVSTRTLALRLRRRAECRTADTACALTGGSAHATSCRASQNVREVRAY